jgi:hypothetical protein
METIQEILDKIIPNNGMVTAIKLKSGQARECKSISFSNNQSRFIFVPNPGDSNARRVLSTVVGTAYDWRDKGLDQQQVKYNQIPVFFGDSYHSYEQLSDRIMERLHIHEITLTDEELSVLFDTPYCGTPYGHSAKPLPSASALRPQPAQSIDHDLDGEETVQEMKDPDFKRNSFVDPKTAYPRCRALWKEHNTQFNDWERKFVQDIGKRLAAHQPLSYKQQKVLGRIFGKFKVKQNATASSEEFN